MKIFTVKTSMGKNCWQKKKSKKKKLQKQNHDLIIKYLICVCVKLSVDKNRF